MKKINKITLALFTVSVLGCDHASLGKKASYVHSVIDSLKIDKSKNILIYTINPNDCINCLIGFVSLNNSLAAAATPKVYIISVEREIEKKQTLRSINSIDLTDTVNKVILWNKNIFIGINRSISVKKQISLSSLTIYNYQHDSILYTKLIREIIGIDEFAVYLEK